MGASVECVALQFRALGLDAGSRAPACRADARHARGLHQLAQQSHRLDDVRRRPTRRAGALPSRRESGSSPMMRTSACTSRGMAVRRHRSSIWRTPDDRLVVTNTFSKSWLMTGWRLGWFVAPPAFVAEAAKLIEYNTSCAPGFVQRAGIVAVRGGEPTIASTRGRFRRRATTCTTSCEALPPSRRWRHPARCTHFSASRAWPTASISASRLVSEVGLGLAPGSLRSGGRRIHPLVLCIQRDSIGRRAVTPSQIPQALNALTRNSAISTRTRRARVSTGASTTSCIPPMS